MESREQFAAVLETVRRELEGGCRNDAIPGGVQSLRGTDYTQIPAGIFNIFRRYPYLDSATRKQALTIVEGILRGVPLSSSDALWLLHLNLEATPEEVEERKRDDLPGVLAECRPDDLTRNRERLLRRYGKAPTLLQSIALAFHRLPEHEQVRAIAVGFKTLSGATILPEELQWAQHNQLQPLVKGNVRSWGERIYHIPGGEFYDVTDVEWFADETMFYTEEQAQSKGWRRSSR